MPVGAPLPLPRLAVAPEKDLFAEAARILGSVERDTSSPAFFTPLKGCSWSPSTLSFASVSDWAMVTAASVGATVFFARLIFELGA